MRMKPCAYTLLVVIIAACGCGDDADHNAAQPATSPVPATAAASGATVDTGRAAGGSGARATGGLIDTPPATQPAAP